MIDAPAIRSTSRKLKTPRAAAIAGILFAVFYSTSLVLIRSSIPMDMTVTGADWLNTNLKMVSLALNLIPYAGIAFLWFIGVIRDQVGELEDHFFSTVFLGSGLVFLALTFVAAALASGLLSSYAILSSDLLNSGMYTYSRAVMYQILNIYAIRMQGVFMISLGTIWIRTGLMNRNWTILSYLLALILLLSISLSAWVTVIFPIWVLAISIHLLNHNLRNQPEKVTDTN
jgi:hypothetical protein